MTQTAQTLEQASGIACKLRSSDAASASQLVCARLEPALHLPHLSGDFLIISSPDDSLVPRRCSALFEALTPEPKEIVHMRGVHVSAKTPDLLAEVVETARRRMVERGIMNP